jgi:hypothetical protein
MASMFLFIGGCQKDEANLTTQINDNLGSLNSSKTLSYSPIFKIHDGILNSNSRNSSIGFVSPDIETVKMILTNIEIQDSILPFLHHIYNNNYSLDVNYSILATKGEQGIDVHIPIFSANSLKGLLYYREFNGKRTIKIMTFNDVQILIKLEDISLEKIKYYYPFIVSFNAINYKKFGFTSLEIDNWLANNFRNFKLNTNSNRLCSEYGWWVQYGYIWMSSNGGCGGFCVAQYITTIICTDPELDPPGSPSVIPSLWGDVINNGGGSGSSKGDNFDAFELSRLFPELSDWDCLDKYATLETIGYLNNLIKNNINNNCVKHQISQKFNDLCKSARDNTPLVNGNGNEVDLIDINGNIFGTAFGGGTSSQFNPLDFELQIKEIEDEIYKLQSTLKDPCTGDHLSIDYNKIKEALCNKNLLNLDNFNKELDLELNKVDYITNGLGNCPKADCMLNKLINVTGSNICDVAQIFDSSTDSNFGVKLETGNLQPVNGIIPYGLTIYSGNEAKIILDINRVCNEPSPLIVAETIMHEMMHALFYESMEKLGWSGSEATRTQFFDQLINNWMSASPGKTHHEIMTEYYLEPMANTLWNLNNQLGQPTDYYGLLLYGLNSTDGGLNNVIINQFNLTSQDILSAYATSLNTVVTPSTLNFTNCN